MLIFLKNKVFNYKIYVVFFTDMAHVRGRLFRNYVVISAVKNPKRTFCAIRFIVCGMLKIKTMK